MREVLGEWQPTIDEEITRWLPREIDSSYLKTVFGEPTYRYDEAAIQAVLSDPVWELLDRGGKRWRPVLGLVLAEGFGMDPHAYLPYAVIPEILHTGTIMVDDIEDDAKMRRGGRSLHEVYGVDVALNAGNALYFLPLKIIQHNPGDLDADARLAIYEMVTHEFNRTHLGQGMDIRWHNVERADIGELEYLEMCAGKTGCLGRIVARLAAIVTDQPPVVESQVAEYAELLSVAFQIGDDILDVEHSLDDSGEFGKEFGNDVREGKKTLLVVHAIEHADPARADRLAAILSADENSNAEVNEAIEILQEADSLQYARERALELAGEARQALAHVDLESEPAETLEAFTRFVVGRDH